VPARSHDRVPAPGARRSDDRTLTNLCLKQGYKAVYQSTSRVFTDAPVGMRKMAKQQLRWARGSQYNTLRMLPWMMRNTPMLALFYVTDIIMPFLLLACASGFVVRMMLGENINFYEGITYGYGAAIGTTIIVVLTLLATWFSVYIRQARHFEDHPRDLILLPAFTLLNTFMLMPIRIWGFMRMARNDGWGTRKNAFHGDEARTTRMNPWGVVPYVLAATMIVAGVAYHG
jgi:hyaluronan synthase